MVFLKSSTAKGKRIINSYESLRGRCKTDVYKNISIGFSNAFDNLYDIFTETEKTNNGRDFRCTLHAGSWSWSCGWKFTTEEGIECIRYETKDNTYIVLLDR